MSRHTPAMSIQLTVADLSTTEAFYAGILELPIRRALTVPGAPEHLEMKVEGCNLIFVEEATVLKVHPVLEERFAMFPKGVGATLHFRVEGLDEIYQAIMEEEMEILYHMEEQPYGIKDLWCFDPDGYLIVLEEPTR
ncbi:VOC family protein [Geobacter pelophilus]|uniref:VOC family protein n=1 Tax=Geoanaerobacter pelophilus TaxID=60036 RepID=A0AAW4LAM4_9BACT|nr:VOC family protein [Geoanaerobacter pelophilus]MBT0665620.1 VOC family protein [Geoanaerobacter pelophilus]